MWAFVRPPYMFSHLYIYYIYNLFESPLFVAMCCTCPGIFVSDLHCNYLLTALKKSAWQSACFWVSSQVGCQTIASAHMAP